jgi:hypothetical protein
MDFMGLGLVLFAAGFGSQPRAPDLGERITTPALIASNFIRQFFDKTLTKPN